MAERFRATVRHEGKEIGDLPFLEEVLVVRYEDFTALEDHARALAEALRSAADGLEWAEFHLKEAGIKSMQVTVTKRDARAALAEHQKIMGDRK